MIKKILTSVVLGLGCVFASAQEAEMVDVFVPHWYVQAQGGVQQNVGEVSVSDLFTFNGQIAVGYQFNHILGARLSANGWQSKAGSNFKFMNDGGLNKKQYNWKWKYISPMVDVTCDLTNLLGGYKQRVCNVGVFAGLGANIAYGNDEAVAVAADSKTLVAYGDDVAYLRYLWDGTKTRLTGRLGANIDFNINSNLSIGAEVNANVLSDRYNSKKAENADWYINMLAGVKYRFGETNKKVAKEVPVRIVEKIVEKPVEKVVEKVVYRDAPTAKAADVREPLRRDIFFLIRGSIISKDEMKKVDEIVDYMKKNPDAKVTVEGHADKGTGNATVNLQYSQKRANVVAKTLQEKGIPSSRIIVTAVGDKDNPYAENEKNRVTICIAK